MILYTIYQNLLANECVMKPEHKINRILKQDRVHGKNGL